VDGILAKKIKWQTWSMRRSRTGGGRAVKHRSREESESKEDETDGRKKAGNSELQTKPMAIKKAQKNPAPEETATKGGRGGQQQKKKEKKVRGPSTGGKETAKSRRIKNYTKRNKGQPDLGGTKEEPL